jgi:hypothetical protein
MKKVLPTKTTNPIHFEDLDPKRFEDLVRELLYDFRDWQSIEATGKGGADDGFDIRAFERRTITSLDEDGNESVSITNGNLWMIQCKREKSIPPSKILEILDDVDPRNPPYGYILAAATNFSKKSFDAFHGKLAALGVMEFHLWGNAHLESELYQPKNDRILFTFFGISNVSRARSRSSAIRTVVGNKNRIMRILGEHPQHSWVLARDASDSEYPFADQYKDFDERPRWKEFEVRDLNPRGIIVSLRQHFGYLDEANGIYDFMEPPFLRLSPSNNGGESEDAKTQRIELERARDYWERLPISTQATFHEEGIIRYEDMLVIDEKGDNWHNLPHIFVDFISGTPIRKTRAFLEQRDEWFYIDELTRKEVFPNPIPEPVFGSIHAKEGLNLPDRISEQLVNYRGNLSTLYDVDGKFNHLKVNDVAVVRFGNKEGRFIQVTQRYEATLSTLRQNRPDVERSVREQLGREFGESDTIMVIEFRNCYRHQWEKRHQSPAD